MLRVIRPILLAEDDVNDAELMLGALRSQGLGNELIHVRDGVAALDYLYGRHAYVGRREGNPAVILLDLKMPRVDGLDVLRHVRADPALKHIPVVILTSSREQHDLLRSYHLGVNAYVVKPVDFDALVEAVRLLGSFWAVVNEPPPAS